MGNIRLSPYYLKRNCNKACYFDKMFLSDIINIRSEIENGIVLLEQKIEELDDHIYEDIQSLHDEQRKKAINITRMLRQKHLKKQVKKQLDENIGLFSEETKSSYKRCLAIIDVIENLRKKLEQTFLNNKNASYTKLIRELNNNYAFRNALMISMNSEVYSNMESLVERQNFPESKKLKDIVMSVQNYYNRMLHKPSPFSTFVNVHIGIYGGNNIKSENSYDSYSQVSINILFLHILESLFLRDDKEFIGELYVKVNPTAFVVGDNVEFLKVDTSNPKYMYYKENFIEIRNNPRIDLILKKAGYKNHHLLTLAREVARSEDYFESMEQVVVFILKLASVGLIYKNFNIDSACEEHLSRLAELCENRTDTKYSKIRMFLLNICAALDSINADCMNLSLKMKCRDSIYDNIRKIFALYSIKAEELNFNTHNIMIENWICPTLEHSELHLQKEEIDKFASVAKLYRIFDNNYITKILYRDIFLKKYGTDEKVRMLTFYKDVEKFHNESDVIENDADIKCIGNMRKLFFDLLSSGLEKDTISITSEDVEKIYKNAPAMMNVPKSYGVYYQKYKGDIIINNTAPGFGRHFMRYVEGLGDKQVDEFISCYKDNVEKTQYGMLYDIGTNLGLNINKHIPCLNNAVAYPQSLYMNAVDNEKKEEYYISYDREYDQLCVSNENGKRIEITPIGFIFSRVAPGYYRFLSAFSNSQGAEISFLDRYHSYCGEEGKSVCYPRIILDNDIMVERRTWKIPCDVLKNTDRLESESYLKLLDAFIREGNIPKRLFAKVSVDIDGILVKNRDIKNWMKEITNKKLRKPQFYDLDNYIDFKNLLRMINNCDSEITIQEVFPDGEEITEYLAEFIDIK